MDFQPCYFEHIIHLNNKAQGILTAAHSASCRAKKRNNKRLKTPSCARTDMDYHAAVASPAYLK